MDRQNWYSDSEPERQSTLHVPPLRTWSANSLLLLILVVMYFLQLVFPGAADRLALRPGELWNPLNWYQLVTHALLHDKHDVLHIFFNGLLLFFFGPPVERVVGGRKPYALFCLAAAVIAGLACIVDQLIKPGISVVGASGICFAVLVALATYDPQREVMLLLPPIRIKMWALAGILMGMEFFRQLISANSAGLGTNTAHAAHIGGGLFGFFFIRHRFQLRRMMTDLQWRRQQEKDQQAFDRKREIDRLLDKINESGITSLSKSEKRFLESVSRDMRKRD